MGPRTLLLLRHAKSSWDDPTFDDFDRPLATRGRQAAPLIGKEMVRRGWLPDAALVSPALRTRQTWDIVSEELGAAIPVTFTHAIYEADAGDILNEVRGTADSVSSLLVVGHNPGLETLALRLAQDGSDTNSLARLKEKFPTAALVRFTFDGAWANLANARLDVLLTPKDFA